MIITLEEMKQYLRVDFDDDDFLIETLITSATRLCIADNSSKGIYLEDGTLVGHLLPAIDGELGKAQKLQRRLSL